MSVEQWDSAVAIMAGFFGFLTFYALLRLLIWGCEWLYEKWWERKMAIKFGRRAEDQKWLKPNRGYVNGKEEAKVTKAR